MATPIAVDKVLRFFNVVGKLKTLKRTGWVNHGIPLPESVADHMYRMSMLSFAVRDTSVDRDRLMKICLVHDLAESIVGDITPHDGVSKEEKRRLEEQALRNIANDLECPEVSEEIISLWMDYEEGTSIECQLAKQLDKLEMIIQADEYEEAHPEKHLDSFFSSTLNDFYHPEVKSWADAIREKRSKRRFAGAL